MKLVELSILEQDGNPKASALQSLFLSHNICYPIMRGTTQDGTDSRVIHTKDLNGYEVTEHHVSEDLDQIEAAFDDATTGAGENIPIIVDCYAINGRNLRPNGDSVRVIIFANQVCAPIFSRTINTFIGGYAPYAPIGMSAIPVNSLEQNHIDVFYVAQSLEELYDAWNKTGLVAGTDIDKAGGAKMLNLTVKAIDYKLDLAGTEGLPEEALFATSWLSHPLAEISDGAGGVDTELNLYRNLDQRQVTYIVDESLATILTEMEDTGTA